MRGLVAYLGSHGQRRGYIASLAPYAETSVDGVQIVNLPAYLLEAPRKTRPPLTDRNTAQPSRQ